MIRFFLYVLFGGILFAEDDDQNQQKRGKMITKGKYPGWRQLARLGIPTEPVTDHTKTKICKCRLPGRRYSTLRWLPAGQRRMVQESGFGSIPGSNDTGASSSAPVTRTTKKNQMKTLSGNREGGFTPGGFRCTGNSEKRRFRDSLRRTTGSIETRSIRFTSSVKREEFKVLKDRKTISLKEVT